jgi:hypothetical protein
VIHREALTLSVGGCPKRSSRIWLIGIFDSLDPAQVIQPSLIRMTTCLIFFEEIFCMGVPARRAGGTPSTGVVSLLIVVVRLE